VLRQEVGDLIGLVRQFHAIKKDDGRTAVTTAPDLEPIEPAIEPADERNPLWRPDSAMSVVNVRQLLWLSPRMILATKAVLLLSQKARWTARLEELAAGLGASCEDVRAALESLAESGLATWLRHSEGAACLAVRPDALTLGDIAKAVADWAQVAACPDDSDPTAPGLGLALSLVRDRVLAGLEQMRLLG
jgi:DNA-binding IscR family transcriptional regulator